MNPRLIFIDPGHGGKDNGAAYGQVVEDQTNLAISFMLDYELRLMGYNTLLGRQRDIDMTLGERAKAANACKADLFVSIHCDAWHKSSASGMTVHYAPISIQEEKCAKAVANQLRIFFPDHRQRGIRISRFYVLRKTKMPAILVECEFLSNPETRNFLDKPENQKRLASAIARGVENYFN